MTAADQPPPYPPQSPADPAEMTLDELRLALGAELPVHATFDGWTATTLSHAATALGVPPDVARLAIPGGAGDMVDAYILASDRRMLAALPDDFLRLRVRERITLALRTRFTLAQGEREAIRRALAVLALPTNLPLAARIGWRTADTIWRAAGDTATDYNHYTKRATLAAIYTSTLLYWLDDASEGSADSWAFLDRRIDDLMRFEKTKAQFASSWRRRPSVARFLGRLRYPAV